MGHPLYIHMPSIRSAVEGGVAKWFTHAVESRINDSLNELVQRIRQEANCSESQHLRKHLQVMAGRLEKRQLADREPFNHPIHFIIVDSAAYHQEKPVEETHTPQVQELARILNRLGNTHGVFVHYISPREISIIVPDLIPEAYTYAHRVNGKTKISPGEAKNIAMAYARFIHEFLHPSRWGKLDKTPAWVIPMNDDIFPAMGEIEWLSHSKAYRNFFLIWKKPFDKPSERASNGT